MTGEISSSARAERLAIGAAVGVSLLLALRWAPIAWGAAADYGWEYEPAWRIAHGEMPYRDFFTTFPPLGNYWLALLLKLFGDSMWVYSANIYLCWGAALFVGWILARKYGLSRTLAAWGVMAAGWVSLPADVSGHAFNYAATVLSGAALWSVHENAAMQSAVRRVLAGLFVGWCVLMKQNVGIFMGAALPLHLMLRQRETLSVASVLRMLWPFGLGVLLGFVPLMAYLANFTAPTEIAHQMFLDAGAAKGGLTRTLMRGVPHFTVLPSVANRAVIMLIISVPLVLGIGCGVRRWLRTSHPVAETSTGGETRWSAGFVLGTIVFLLVPIADNPAMRALQAAIVPQVTLPYTSQLVLALYTAIVWLGIFAAIQGWRKRDAGLLALVTAAGGVAYAHATSNVEYLRYSAPVVIPLVVALSVRLVGAGRALLGARILAVVAAVTMTISPMYARNFERLRRIEGPPAFAGLYARDTYWPGIDEMRRDWVPLFAGRRTLWLIEPGPHAAFGGAPVPNVPSYYLDTYSSRLEERLMTIWEKDLPEFVVLGNFARAPNAQKFTHPNLLKWLRGRYVMVRGSAENGAMSLWRRAS